MFQEHQWPPTASNPLGEGDTGPKRTATTKPSKQPNYVPKTTWVGGEAPAIYRRDPLAGLSGQPPLPANKAKPKKR